MWKLSATICCMPLPSSNINITTLICILFCDATSSSNAYITLAEHLRDFSLVSFHFSSPFFSETQRKNLIVNRVQSCMNHFLSPIIASPAMLLENISHLDDDDKKELECFAYIVVWIYIARLGFEYGSWVFNEKHIVLFSLFRFSSQVN